MTDKFRRVTTPQPAPKQKPQPDKKRELPKYRRTLGPGSGAGSR